MISVSFTPFFVVVVLLKFLNMFSYLLYRLAGKAPPAHILIKFIFIINVIPHRGIIVHVQQCAQHKMVDQGGVHGSQVCYDVIRPPALLLSTHSNGPC